jgi:signal recognition particle receptor subunit beta
MATLNYAFKEISCKIVYYGCGLCGKTTNLIHVHKTVPGKFRGDLVSLATEQDRTLFFDFLPLDLGEVKGFKTKFQLYTVPGQVYYNATRKLVLRGVDGLVFVADSQRDRIQENLESFNNLKENLEEYSYKLKYDENDYEGIPWILQLNKRDMPQIISVEEIVEALGIHPSTPMIDAVAVNGTGVRETLKAMSSLVIKRLNSSGGALGSSSPAPAADKPKAEAVPAKKVEFSAGKQEKREQPAPAPKPAPIPVPEPVKPEPLVITQECVGLWRGMKSGTGYLTLTQHSTNMQEFNLSGTVSFMLGKREFNHQFQVVQETTKDLNGKTTEFLILRSAEGQKPLIEAQVATSERMIFLQYPGFLGQVTVLPFEQKQFPSS